MTQSPNLSLDLHNENEFHASSSSISFPSLQELRLNNSISLPMVQELGFHWNTDGDRHLMNPESCTPKSNNDIKELGININFQDQHNIVSNCHIIMQEFNQINGLIEPNFEPVNFDDNNGRWSLPSANSSSLNHLSQLNSTSSLGMRQPSTTINNMDLLSENIDSYQLKGSTHASMINNNNKVVPLSSISGVTGSKRSSTPFNSKASQNHAPKKQRLDSLSSFTPFKVRKEKLGDRIAALQQLVAPFGKTDTASVLTEVIGYINFLQDQVQTLSMPYMSSSNSKGNDEEHKDLRSKGLCLVPLSCMSCVPSESYEVWSPANYNYYGGIKESTS